MLKPWLIRLLSIVTYYTGVIRYLRFLGRKNAKIVLYHSVAEHETDFIRGTGMCVPPEVFENQVKYLLKHYRVISLRELVENLNSGRSPDNAVVITFDDGFADVYHHAYPFLKQHGLPATIFLNTESVGNGNLNWIQELCYLTNTAGPSLVTEKLRSIRPNSGAESISSRTSSGPRLHRRIEKFLAYSVDKWERKEILDNLFRDLEIERSAIPGRDDVFLNWEQIREMANHGIDFGNHGMSHTPFSSMSPEDRESEIRESRNILEKHLELDFIPFSCPFGQARDIPPDLKERVYRSGHDCALTAMPTLNGPDASPHELGRIPADNSPIYRFAFELEVGALKKLLHWKSKSEIFPPPHDTGSFNRPANRLEMEPPRTGCTTLGKIDPHDEE